ncbi:MAG TPA: hypothetical protein VMY40_07820 [Anaerolineae bacterium]|nr:hypothetical protein [Anaerolineae bacterium]
MKTAHLALLSLLVLTLAACELQPQPTPEAVPGTPARPTPESALPGQEASPLPEPDASPLPEPGMSLTSPLPSPPTPALTAAVVHLAAELDISSEEVTVLSSERVEWPDASLGCPQPGMVYAQVVTPGYLFLLEAAGDQYEVHTDLTEQSVVICHPSSGDLSDPEAAFQVLLARLMQTALGFGLDQQGEWVPQDITKAAVVGISTWAWRSGEWTLEMTFPAVPQPAYESVLFHQRAGTVWRGTLEADGRVTPLYEPLALSFDVKPCDETVPPDALNDRAGMEISVRDGAVHIEQHVSTVCCAELALAAGRDGDVIRVIETNVGQVCRCMCGYPVTADLTGLPAGTYTVEVWGVQHYSVHPLEMRGSGEVTIP